jgi:low affinity Fe/Cu permease
VRAPNLQSRLSRILRNVGDVTSRASVAALAAFVTASLVLALALLGFPNYATQVFSAAVSAIALIMLFVIQHTQSRQQSVTQLKLDELIRTSPMADDHLVHIELAEDHEITALETQQVEHHVSVRESAERNETILWTPPEQTEEESN